jgi:hypothetical protein
MLKITELLALIYFELIINLEFIYDFKCLKYFLINFLKILFYIIVELNLMLSYMFENSKSYVKNLKSF